MIIDSAKLHFSSQHQLKKETTHQESLEIIKRVPARSTAPDVVSAQSVRQTEQLDLSAEVSATDSLKASIVRQLFKSITGKDFKLFSAQDLKTEGEANSLSIDVSEPSNTSPDVGLIYRKTESLYESEQSHFFAEGVIQTQDGASINFSVSLSMSREFSQQSSMEIRTGAAEKIDPLVINFSGNAAELTDTSFAFDLDVDGETEQLATLKQGSAFLALDKNKDGVINNGSELFGPMSGAGFAELAEYDDDKNGFIDEADAVYDKLRLWQQNSDGSQQLMALGDKEIGAIYLGHVSTPFQLTNQQNVAQGEVSSTGIYLQEGGAVGTVQQIDYKV